MITTSLSLFFIMDPTCNDPIASLLNADAFQHDLMAMSGLKQQPIQEDRKQINQSRRKGRPKGLKTNKDKVEGREDRKNENKNSGHWSQQQKKRYHLFLERYSKHFIMKQLRRMDKIFKIMADFIGSREAQQCRSHHQKMQKKYSTFYKILKSLRQEFYVSADASHIKADLENRNIFDYDPLIQEEQLDNENAAENEPDAKSQQAQPHMDMDLGRVRNDASFFMGDHYELNFHHQGL